MSDLGQVNKQEVNLEEYDETNLYVKGLWKECTQSDLKELFSSFGNIVQSRIYGNGVAFVQFETSFEAYKAILNLNNTRPHRRSPQPLVVKFANKSASPVRVNHWLSQSDDGKENIITNDNSNNENSKTVIIIANLPISCDEYAIYILCSVYGIVINLCLFKNSNKFACVKFFDNLSGNRCIKELNNKLFPNTNNRLTVKFTSFNPFETNESSKTIPRMESNSNMNNFTNDTNYTIDNYNCLLSSAIQLPQVTTSLLSYLPALSYSLPAIFSFPSLVAGCNSTLNFNPNINNLSNLSSTPTSSTTSNSSFNLNSNLNSSLFINNYCNNPVSTTLLPSPTILNHNSYLSHGGTTNMNTCNVNANTIANGIPLV